jgi:dTDP-glucose pyrophosphorylase/transcriptional regulator with XRE-family HTH domain
MRLARRRHGLTLTALAARLGYSKPYISAVENGTTKPSRAILAAYADAFGVPVADLLGEAASAQAERPAAAARPVPVDKDLDGAVSEIAAEFGLSERELGMIREMVLDDARHKASALRGSLDWWRDTGPVPVCCVPVAGWQWREWPFEHIVHAIDRAAAEAMEARMREIVVILPPEKIPEMERAFKRPPFAERLQHISCVPQTAALGLGHALLQARGAIGERPFAILLPDDRFDHFGAEASVLRQLIAQRVDADHVVAVAKLKDTGRQYGVARLGPGTRRGQRGVELLVEKPDQEHPVFRRDARGDAGSVYAVVGRYLLSPSIFAALVELRQEQGAGQKLELLDAMQRLIERHEEHVNAYILPSVVQLDRDATVYVTSSPGHNGTARIA